MQPALLPTTPKPLATSPIDSAIHCIIDRLRQSAASYLAAGQAYAELLDAHGRTAVMDRLTTLAPSVSSSVWSKLERIGRGLCDERILTSYGRAYSSLSYVPISEQREALDRGVDYLAADGSVVRLKVDALDSKQAAQVIASNHIRSIEEQRAYIAQRAPQESKPKGKAYVDGGKLVVTGKCTLSRFELATIMAQMGG